MYIQTNVPEVKTLIYAPTTRHSTTQQINLHMFEYATNLIN